MDTQMSTLPLTEIEQRYPNQWVLVEETTWDAHGYPTHGLVRAVSGQREELQAALHTCHQRPQAKTFIFYTGDKIPTDLTVVL
jgi:hypothetical protein